MRSLSASEPPAWGYSMGVRSTEAGSNGASSMVESSPYSVGAREVFLGVRVEVSMTRALVRGARRIARERRRVERIMGLSIWFN